MIFISYARADRVFAEKLAGAIERAGLDTWWDGEIPAGSDFRAFLDERLKSATRIVVLWSNASKSSRWVAEEADEGASRGILMPVMIDQSEIPRGFRAFQAADLSRWNGADDDPDLLKFIDDLKSPLSVEGAPTQTFASNDVDRFERAKTARTNTLICGIAALGLIVYSVWDYFQIGAGFEQSRIRLLSVFCIFVLALLAWFVRGPASSWIMALVVVLVSGSTLLINASFSNPEFGLATAFTPLNLAVCLVVGIGLGAMSVVASIAAAACTIIAYGIALAAFSSASPIFVAGTIMNLSSVGIALCVQKYLRGRGQRAKRQAE
jgi:hypothetical protein